MAAAVVVAAAAVAATDVISSGSSFFCAAAEAAAVVDSAANTCRENISTKHKDCGPDIPGRSFLVSQGNFLLHQNPSGQDAHSGQAAVYHRL